jgi:hypothetical protein
MRLLFCRPELQFRRLALKVRECYKPHHEVSNANRLVIVFGCLAALAACGTPARPSLDTPAAEYVRLARLGDRLGAAHLAEIERARLAVAAVDEHETRRAFLLAQLAALARRARFLAGETVSIRDEAAALGMPLPEYDATRAHALRGELERALPGPGPLASRLAAHHRAKAVPRARLDDSANRAVADCRARTPVPSDLHDAGVNLRYVVDQPWPAFTHYEGGSRSRVDLRRDVMWRDNELASVLCHETYPGHHLQNLLWQQLASRWGWVELTVTPMFTGHAVMAERAAVAAVNLALPPASREPVSRILDRFAPLALATAIAAVDGHLEHAAAIDRLHDELLMPDAAGFLAFVGQYRSMAVAYVTPADDIRDWSRYFAVLRSHELLAAGSRQ